MLGSRIDQAVIRRYRSLRLEPWCLMPSRLIPGATADDHRIRPLPSAPSAPPALLWPSTDGRSPKDATQFPLEWEIRRRRDLCGTSSMTLPVFARAVATAHHRLFIMDRHFDETGVKSLQHAFEGSQASDVRLLTGSMYNLDKMRKVLEICINSRRHGQQVNVRWKAVLRRDCYPFLHDRFAVVDDALWHFGATVGGGHPGLNAASGPWPAEKARAVEFFQECWRAI